MKRIILLIITSFAVCAAGYSQLLRPEYDYVAGYFSDSFTYTHTANTVNLRNKYTGRPTNDAIYQFFTSVPMDIEISHCGSAVVNGCSVSRMPSAGWC